VVEHPPIADDDPFVVVTDSAHTQGGLVTVLVGRNLDLVRETITNVTHGLIVGVPILVLIVGFTTWSVVGRALAPVESMRKEVTRISETELHRRVSDPPGRDEIARLATTMNEMLARLEVAHDRQQRLVSDAAHELRNPIASIRHHAEVALAHPDRTALEAVTAEILAEDLRLQRLVEDLLLLARADEHALELNARPVDVDDLVLEEARRLGRTTELRVDIAGVTAARTQGDATQLQRVVRNLADNAARHAGSIVRFSLQETDGHIRLEVEDDGPGIPTKDREVVFERFARLDDARDREHGGAGLGLAIAREIVAAHGGETWVVDASLGGACLVVQLPLMQPTPL
jgi:signal transduction histidine kinase